MTDTSSLPELLENSNEDVLELNKNLERLIEDVEDMSVKLTWMAYDMVAVRTSPELGASLLKLEEAYQRCRAAVCGDQSQEPEMDKCPDPAATTLTQIFQMENPERGTEQATSTACVDLENILKGLDCLSNCMDQLAVQTQLRQCDLIVCVGRPDKLPLLKVQEALKQPPQPPSLT